MKAEKVYMYIVYATVDKEGVIEDSIKVVKSKENVDNYISELKKLYSKFGDEVDYVFSKVLV